MATNAAAAAAAFLVHRAGEQFLAGAAGAEQHHRDAGRGDALDGLGDLEHFGRAADHRSEHRHAAVGFEPAILGFDAVQMEGAGDDQPELVDVDRLAIEIIGAAGDRLERAFAGAVARGDDDLGVGLEANHLDQRREAFFGAVGIGRQAEVERYHRRLVQPQRLDRRRAVAGDDDAIAVIGPFELALQALVVLDDQQDGKVGRLGHALFRSMALAGSAASLMVKMVPLAGLAVDAQAAAHRGDQRARLERADAEAVGLGRGEGLEQPVADEVAVHAAALIGDGHQHAVAVRARRGR